MKNSKQNFLHILVIITLLVPILLFSIYRITGSYRINKHLSIFKSQGLDINFEDLDYIYQLPIGTKNAANEYNDAFNYIIEWDKVTSNKLPIIGEAKLPTNTTRIPSHTKTLINNYLTDNQAALSLLHNAAKIQNCRYPKDFSKGLDMPWPDLSGQRKSIRLLQLEGMNHLDNGETGQAVQSLVSGLALSQSIHPTFASEQRNRDKFFNRGIQILEQILSQQSLTEEQIQTIISRLNRQQCIENLKLALQGTCSYMSLFFQKGQSIKNIIVSRQAPPLSMRHLNLQRTFGILQHDRAGYLECTQAYINALNLPPHKCLPIINEIQTTKYGGSITQTTAPPLAYIIKGSIEAISRQRLALCALAIESYRLEHKALPQNLKQLVPNYNEAVPLDPYDGKPLRYQKRTPGYILYSIGEDLSDDGGKEKPKKTQGETWDVTFIVER